MKIERLIGILSILLQQEKVTAPYLAEKFEVSRRTINRDIEEICMAGIPLVTTQGQNGGISIMEGFSVDKTLLTSSEMQDILTGLKSLDSISGTKKYQQLMDKLSVSDTNVLSSNQHIMIDLSCWNKSLLAPKIELIQHAISEQHIITFTYYSQRGKSMRSVEPYVLIFQWSSWYLWGYCLKRHDYRLFKLNRLVELLETDTKYEIRTHERPDIADKYQFPKKIAATAVFEPAMRWRLIDEYGSECFIERKDGKLELSYGFVDAQSLINWILSYGDQVELIEPKEIRNEIMTTIRKISGKYKEI